MRFKQFLLEKIKPSIEYSHDYYADLGLDKTATQDEIKKAYRVLSMKYHPDRNKDLDSESKFKKVKLAYEILSDLEWKDQYDYKFKPSGKTTSKPNYSTKSSTPFKIASIHLEILDLLKKTKQNSLIPFNYLFKKYL